MRAGNDVLTTQEAQEAGMGSDGKLEEDGVRPIICTTGTQLAAGTCEGLDDDGQ
jgi:hypothetical protein